MPSSVGKSVFVLGAGASMPHGIPGFAKFRDRAEALLAAHQPLNLLPIIWRRAYESLNLEEFYTLVRFQSEIDAKINAAQIRNFSPEELDLLRGSSFLDWDVLSFPELIRGLEEMIPLVVFGSCNIGGDGPVYGTLAHAIADLRSNGGYNAVEAISFNWDSLLEEELQKLNLHPRYPRFPPERGLDWVRVIKPHGSLNLECCIGCAGTIWRQGARPQLYGGTSWMPDQCEKCHHPRRPLLLAPHFAKGSPEEVQYWFSDSWKQLFKALRGATRLYVVGYSFPITDYQVQLTFRNALAMNQSLQEIVVVTDEKPSAEYGSFTQHYLDVFRKAGKERRLRFYFGGAAKWVKEIGS